jgi:hypothetical protein
MRDDEKCLVSLLEYTKHRYDSSLRAMVEIGDANVDDVYELMKITHEQLKELLQILSVKTPERQSIIYEPSIDP